MDRRSDLSYEINEPDAYALEAGCNSRKRTAGSVALSAARSAWRRPSARRWPRSGRAIHIVEEDGLAYPALPGSAGYRGCWRRRSGTRLRTWSHGLESDDLGYGQTGAILAELLGLPHATIVMHVEKVDGGIRVKRELENGWFQHVEMPLPACSPFNPVSASCATPR